MYYKIIDTTGVTQISTSDPDSQIMTRNNISEVAYTVQTTVDALHIPIDFKESNLLKQYPKALRCYLLLLSCFFMFFFPTANSIYNKKTVSNRLYLLF
jgi:hypothetical protein